MGADGPPRGPLLALDLGNRRIGLAIGAAPDLPSVPLGFQERTTLRQDVGRLLDTARELDVAGLVVGMPYTLSGESGRQAELTRGFIKELRRHTNLRIYTVDERYTSAEAESLLRDAGTRPSRDKGQVDAVAATLILERFWIQEGHGARDGKPGSD